MQLCYACTCLTLSSSIFDMIRQLGAWTVIAATMQMGTVATGNIAIEACCLITQQAWHAAFQMNCVVYARWLWNCAAQACSIRHIHASNHYMRSLLSVFAGALAGSLQKWRWHSQWRFSSHTLKCNLSAVKMVMGSMAALRLMITLSNTSQWVRHFLNPGTLTGCFHEPKQDGKLASDGQRLRVK